MQIEALNSSSSFSSYSQQASTPSTTNPATPSPDTKSRLKKNPKIRRSLNTFIFSSKKERESALEKAQDDSNSNNQRDPFLSLGFSRYSLPSPLPSTLLSSEEPPSSSTSVSTEPVEGDVRLLRVLEELKLAKYWNKFLAEELLLEDLESMTEDDLMCDFGMTKWHSRRLIRAMHSSLPWILNLKRFPSPKKQPSPKKKELPRRFHKMKSTESCDDDGSKDAAAGPSLTQAKSNKKNSDDKGEKIKKTSQKKKSDDSKNSSGGKKKASKKKHKSINSKEKRGKQASISDQTGKEKKKGKKAPIKTGTSFEYREVSKEDLEWEDGVISSGTFGVVYRGRWRGVNCAIKQLRVTLSEQPKGDEAKLIREFRREAALMQALGHHPNCLCFFGAITLGERICLVTEVRKPIFFHERSDCPQKYTICTLSFFIY